jgi:hypothetical protein
LLATTGVKKALAESGRSASAPANAMVSGLQLVPGQVSNGALRVFEFHQLPWNSTIARMYFSEPVFDGPLRSFQFWQKARWVQFKYGILKSLLPVGLSTSVRDYLHEKVLL